MSLGIRYTRGFLLDLKRRLSFIKDAHELLEMKRDQLVREIKDVISRFQELRRKVELEMESLYRDLAVIHAIYGSKELISSSRTLSDRIEVEVLPRSIMGVDVPEVKIKHIPDIKDKYPPHIAKIAEKASAIISDLLRLAEVESLIEQIAEDLRNTNVRVNALEKVVIPTYENLIKQIGEIIDQSLLEEFMRIKLVKRALMRRRGQA